MGESVDPSVKKRSLSSYLSNVSLRREELEKLKKKQEEERQEIEKREAEEDQNLIIQQQQEQEAQERLRKEQENRDKKANASLQQINENTQLQEQAVEHKTFHGPEAKELKSEKKDTLANFPGTKEEDEEHLSHKESEDHDSSIRPAAALPSSNDQQISHNNSFTRQELHSILKEPTGRNEVEQERHGVEADQPPKLGGNGDEESDVASDAPTEPASPPRPRRGRLIRGDRLQSMSPSHSTFDNESDSELSDIDELKSIHISSSIIHGDSSPIKGAQDDIRRRRHVSSPRIDKGRSGSPRQLKSHISTPKISRQKKGVYRDAGGRTRLQISCDKGNYEQARKLIEEEHYDVNDQDNAGNSALHEAALNGHLEIVKLLTRNGADVNIQSFEMFKDTPLIDASANGHLDVVKYLLSHGADPTICNAKGLTAYESIEEDSDLDEQEQEIVAEIKNHLRSAAKHWKNDMITHNVNTTKDKHQNNLSQRRQESEELLGDFEFFWTDITSRAGKQKLLKASKEGKLSYVGSYLENGGRIDLKSFFEAVKLGHEDVTSLFLAFGAQVNAVSKDGTTALISAVGRGHVGTVKLLLEAGADPRRKDKSGHTALYYAENSPMGVVDSEEVALIGRALSKFGVNSRDIEEKSNKKQFAELTQTDRKIEKRDVKQEDSNVDEDENVINVGRKRRTISPVRFDIKRQASSATSNIDESLEPMKKPEDGSKKSSVEPETVKAQEETPEEREQRIKAEEEYIQRRLQNKRKKEQELLRKLALDDEQKEKERAEQRIKEVEKMHEQQRLKEIELDNQKKEQEILRRRKIRSLYPLGLRLIDFNDTPEGAEFLPLYYTELGTEKVKYVLDLHLCVIFKNQALVSATNKIPVAVKHKKQLWNIFKSTFLYGGPKNRRLLTWESMDLQSRIQFEAQEFSKFCNLPMNWIKLQDINLNDTERRKLEQDMVQIALVEPNEEPVQQKNPVSRHPEHSAQALALPNRLQRRRTVSQLLQNYNSQSLW